MMLILKIHTYHSRFVPEGVAEVSQIDLRDKHALPKLVSCEELDGRVVSALGVRSRKLSNGLNGQS
jgi:hypothetical protein